MKDKQKKFLTIPLENKSTTSGVVRGYGAVFGNTDAHQDIIVPGAFARTLTERTRPVHMVWQHDMTQPIGAWKTLEEDDHGLLVEGPVLNVPGSKGHEVCGLLDLGAPLGLSVGYYAVKARYDDDRGIRYLEDLELIEISVVTEPSNELSRAGGGSKQDWTTRRVEQTLRDAGMSKTQAKSVACHGFRSSDRWDAGSRDSGPTLASLLADGSQLFK